MRNPDLFQGEKYLKKNSTNYFEGYYFKNISKDFGISFIPGINIVGNKKEVFIQIVTNNESWYINYDINDFEYNNDPLWIRIGNNYFSENRIHLDIKDRELDLNLFGELKYSKGISLKRKILSPNIMGIFSYLPFMECNHAILKMKNRVNGFINLNDKKIEFIDGTGYIEKDFGCSFPKRYIWGEGNCFKDNSSSFMFSIADIPFKIFSFEGLICSLIVNDREYRFATYNGSRIKRIEFVDNRLKIILKKRKYILEIECDNNNSLMLKAPVNGNMEKEILESIDSIIKVTLKKKNKVIFSDISTNCGLEIVK